MTCNWMDKAPRLCLKSDKQVQGVYLRRSARPIMNIERRIKQQVSVLGFLSIESLQTEVFEHSRDQGHDMSRMRNQLCISYN